RSKKWCRLPYQTCRAPAASTSAATASTRRAVDAGRGGAEVVVIASERNNPGTRPPGRGTGDTRLSIVSDLLVWIDCEMTGLDLSRDKLIEVAAVVTDADLKPLYDGVDVVIGTDDATLAGMLEVVRDMHDRSGLTEAVRASKNTLDDAEEIILGYVRRHVPEPRTAPLCGNSIATDRGFLAR